ncbi:MAG: helix-turn-helix domain-containing protein [Bryobacteraceae bacterium]|nr:helix-turn-helix domain-containing protein [Bryobacteraceae bacterium]
MLNQLLTIDQAQSVLPMSRAWFAKRRWDGTGPEYVKIGTRIFYPRNALVAFAEQRAVRQAEPGARGQELRKVA